MNSAESPKLRRVVAPPPSHPDLRSTVLDVDCADDEDVEWQWTVTPAGRFVSGYRLVPRPYDTAFAMSELERAAALVGLVMPPTPQYAWPKLKVRAGCTVWVKHENHTPTGAFKVRGGLVYMDRLRQAGNKIPNVISATRGNHGQSIAFAAARSGIPATIYVPRNNSQDQNSAIAGFGARVVEFGKDFDEAKHEAIRVAAAEGLHFVPSFHRDLVTGVATYALELLRSVAAGRAVNAPAAKTFADGLATREPNAEAIARICRGASRIVEVTENEIADAMRIYFDDTHQIAEGAGAAPLAALLQERHRMANKNVAVVFTGGNIERARFLQVLSGVTPSVA
jgi:threonine dehydratase